MTHSKWRRWGHALLIVIALEVGLVLLTLPWTRLWAHSAWVGLLQASHPGWANVLLSPYLRGALSGLGLINLWIATSDITPLHRDW